MARLRGEPADVRTRVAVAALLRELRQVTRAYASRLRVRYDDEDATAGGEVVVDRSEIVAALANLVKNAVEALPPSGGEVRVSAAADGIAVVFSVSDSGAGIPPELLPRIFERSFTHGKAGGTGLGLSHVRAVAQRHGGRVEVESEVGRGTTVRIRLPRAPAAGA
jgi:signal transduction histidine kinase